MKRNISCSPRSRCKKWKECPDCAKLRQFQIANVAEKGASTSRAITYAVVRPLTNDIANQKNRILKHLKSKIDGGIWTIETGKETAGLHVNLIIGSDSPIVAADIAAAVDVEASIYAEHVAHKDVRKIAAYSSKQSAYPHKDQYAGRFYGSFGTFKTPLQAASNCKSPVIELMALEQRLDDLGVPLPQEADIKEAIGYKEGYREKVNRIKVNEEERERVDALNARNEMQAKYMRRILAVVRDEIELNGFAYVDGFGLMGKRELIKYGLCTE